MKKKTKKGIDQPALFAVILIVVIVLITGIVSKGKWDASKQENSATENVKTEELRNGQQVAGISIKGDEKNEKENSGSMAMHTEMSAIPVLKAVPAGTRVKFKIEKFQKLATQPLKFNVYDEKGKELTPDLLQTSHEKKLHFVLVSSDLKDYLHLHPVYAAGVWNVSAPMTKPGTYYAYIDVTPIQGNPIVLKKDLIVREASTENILYPGLTPDTFALNNGYKAQVKIETTMSGQTIFSYQITKEGKPIKLEPYLESFAHVVVLKHKASEVYIHLHPLLTSEPSNGIVELAGDLDSGNYTAFAEVKIAGKVLLFPITFNIP